ncbi:MAG: hypothetical protein MJZ50_04980 [Treponema sp.]|nr:hypothetical protein [Treponema sp.]
MKMTRKLIGIAATFAAAIYMAGCSNLFESATVDDSDSYKMVENGSQQRTISGSIGVANGTRTILPAALDLTDINDYQYFLRGTSITGKTFNSGKNKKLTVSPATAIYGSTGQGTFTETIDADIWDLTVFAVPSTATQATVEGWGVSDIIDGSILIGYANVDLTTANTTVSFKLSPDGLANPGTLNFDVKLQNNAAATPWSNTVIDILGTGATVNMNVRNLITGDVIKLTGGTSDATATPSFTGGSAKFNPGSVAPGTYNFTVTFLDASNKEFGEWSDILVVLPGRSVTQDVYIPNIIGLKPAAPASFTAVYYKDSEDVPRTGFYKVHFQWANTPVNEKYYELQIIPIDGTLNGAIPGTLPATTVLYTQKGTRSDTLKYFVEAPERVDGSLFANNTDCTVYLELGHEYQAQIRSVNAIGESAWVDLTLPTTAPTIPNVPAAGISCFAVSTTADKCMNRYRLAYNLNGGRYKPASGVTKSSPKVVYNSIHDPASPDKLALWGGDGFDTTHSAADSLVKGSATVTNWVLDLGQQANSKVADISASWVATPAVPTAGSQTGQSFTADGYEGWANATVYATYGAVTYSLSGSIDITDPANYKLLPSYVSYACSKTGTQTGACGGATDTSGAITVSKAIGGTGSETIVFSVNVPTGANNIKFDTVTLEVFKSDLSYAATPQSMPGAALGSANTFGAVDVSGYDNGAYSVVVTGKAIVNGNTITRKCNITLTITD